MHMLFKFLLDIMLVALILYSKVMPYSDRLSENNKKIYRAIDKFVAPISKILNKSLKATQIGDGLSLDSSHLLLMLILIFIINII